jgi:hypothetical protein
MAGQRQIITIATGKKLYVDFAVNLARSFFWWHPDTDIKFQLVTDQPDFVPADVKEKTELIIIAKGEIGEGFSTKLHLDKLIGEGQTLFIDSDCLVYRNLDNIFEQFKGHAVSVVGDYISKGEWFGEIEPICKKFNITHMPKFNGGVYYLEKGEMASKVYNTARQLEPQYDEIGFKRLRNRPNDEVLMALAMELNRQVPVADDGSILAEFVNFKSGVKSDLLNGVAELYNSPTHPEYQEHWPLQIAKPAMVHFLGHHNQIMPYIKEVKQLEYVSAKKRSVNVAKQLTFLHVTLPAETASWFKNTLRPLYHSLFGARKIKKSERIID